MSMEMNISDNNKMDSSKVEVGYDNLLSAAGELGRYQWILFFATSPLYAFGVFVYYSQLFITEVSPNHWCRIPELKNFTDIQRRNIGVPRDSNSKFGYSRCEMYAVNWSEELVTGQKVNQSWITVPCQYGWEFNKSEIPYPTIGSELEWVCEKNSYQATAQSIFFVGSICGGLVFGWIADRYGRLPAIISSCLVGCVGGTASTFARNLLEFAAARFVMGMSYDTCMCMAYLLFLEYIGPNHRTLMANLAFAIFYCLFVSALPWIALACGHWKLFCLATSLPFALAIFLKLILPESPRWLLSQGRIDEAIEKVLFISRINKKEISVNMIEEFRISANINKNEENLSWIEIFKRPLIRNMFILVCIVYMCGAIVFDVLLRSIGQLDYNFFLSFSLISLTEFPAMIFLAFTMDLIGRRWMCIVFMTLSCVFYALSIISNGVLTVIYAVVARFSTNIVFSSTMQWTPELLPTPVRGSGAAITYICGYAAAFLAPYIVYLHEYVYWLPMCIIGGITVVGIYATFVLPETALVEMPQTFEEVEELIRKREPWTAPFLKSRRNKKEGQVNKGFEPEM